MNTCLRVVILLGLLITAVDAFAAGTSSRPRPQGATASNAPAQPRPPVISERAPAPGAPLPPTGGIDSRKQLMITDLRVVEDPLRTNPANGARATWTFKYLMENLAGTNDPALFTLRWLQLWERDQHVNGHRAAARPDIRRLVIDPWLRASGGRRLDLARAPFKLLAIVNRTDLRMHDGAEVLSAGEGRFVFGVLGADGKPLPPSAGPAPGGFTVIFEYELGAGSMRELGDWALQWKRLGDFPLGSPDYNRALEQITRRFTDRGRAPGAPNGSAINQIRSNEIALGPTWELREFVLGPSGFLRQGAVALTPDTLLLNGTAQLAALINAQGGGIASGPVELAPEWFAASSLAGPFVAADFTNFASRTFTTNVLFDPLLDIPWSAAGITNNNARHAFALNTCNGCHRDETGTGFLQVGFPASNSLPRSLGMEAALAGFLTGVDVRDPVDPSTTRHFADLERRCVDFQALCESFGATGAGPGPRGTHIPRFVH